MYLNFISFIFSFSFNFTYDRSLKFLMDSRLFRLCCLNYNFSICFVFLVYFCNYKVFYYIKCFGLNHYVGMWMIQYSNFSNLYDSIHYIQLQIMYTTSMFIISCYTIGATKNESIYYLMQRIKRNIHNIMCILW